MTGFGGKEEHDCLARITPYPDAYTGTVIYKYRKQANVAKAETG
jgi:hypothetical protein